LEELPDPTNGAFTNGSMSYDTNPKNSSSIGGGVGSNTVMNGKGNLLDG
jgi:hypothetical protein